MIILTERLKTIADNVDIGERVADVGTDHGYLPLYLFEKKISPKVVLSDVSKGSLLKAEENCRRMYPENEFDLRLGDGLDILEKGEVDTVVMAGIGGLLTVEILDWDLSKSFSFKKYILQPRNNGGQLRRYLYEQGFHVEKIIIVPENKKLCEIMVVYPPKAYEGRIDSSKLSDYEFEFPELMKDSGDENMINYLRGIRDIENRIIVNIIAGREKDEHSNSDNSINENILDKYLDDPAIMDHRLRVDRINYLLGE